MYSFKYTGLQTFLANILMENGTFTLPADYNRSNVFTVKN